MRLIKVFLALLLVFSNFMITPTAQQQPAACSTYELAWVNDSGGFDTVGCYNTFDEAKAAMNQKDYVIRHPFSKSPMKIIAVASGIAVSYPRRNGSVIMDVFQHVNHITESQKYKSTYVVQHRELNNPETISYNGNGEGNVKVILNGFTGYANLSEMDLIPMKFLEKGWSVTLGGQTNDTSTPEDPFTLIMKQSYYSVEQNGKYTDLIYHYFSGYDGVEYKLIVGPAANWMNVGSVYYSPDGVTFYKDRTMKKEIAQYYNYYQFLPLRSISKITGSILDTYLNSKGFTSKPESTSINKLTRTQSQLVKEGKSFIEAQNTYGVNALLVYAMACNESGYGRSNYAVSKNNLFGWNAVDDNPDNASSFTSIASGITEHMAYNLRMYMDVYHVNFFGMHLGNKASGMNVKYASDPYWGMKIAAIAYDIDKFSKNYDGTLTDYHQESLGLIQTFKASYYKEASINSSVLFTSEYSSQYQNNHIVILKDSLNGYYQVQTPNAILEDGTVLKHYTKVENQNVVSRAVPYDMERSTAYILKSDIVPVQQINESQSEGLVPDGDFVMNLTQFEVSSKGLLSVSGSAYRPGIYINQDNQIIHTLIVYNHQNDIVLQKKLNSSLQSGSKEIAMFKGTVDLHDLEDGEYTFRLKSEYTSCSEYSESYPVYRNVSDTDCDDFLVQFDCDDVLKMTISSVEQMNTISSLKSISLDEHSVLSLQGISIIRKENHTLENTVHELVVTDLNTLEEVYCVPLKSSLGSYSLTEVYQDGYNYDYGWYEDSVDLSVLPKGNYVLSVRTTVGSSTVTSKLYGTSKMKESMMMEGTDGLYRQLIMRYAFSYRVEIAVNAYCLNVEKKQDLPRIREGYQNLISLKYNETENTLRALGSAFIWNVSFDKQAEVIYTLYALNKTDGTVVTSSVSGSHLLLNEIPPWDNTEEVQSGFDYSKTWYCIDLSLGSMSSGEYEFMLVIETKDYVEAIDLKKSSDSGLDFYQSEHLNLNVFINRNDKNKVQMTLEKAD